MYWKMDVGFKNTLAKGRDDVIKMAAFVMSTMR